MQAQRTHPYKCGTCGETAEIQLLWVLPEVYCDNCGWEMRPVKPEAVQTDGAEIVIMKRLED